MYIKIGDVCQNHVDSDIDIKCTVMQKSQLGTCENTSSGKKLSGVLCDDTGRLDFISWNESATALDQKLSVGLTYTMEQVRVKQCAPVFSTTDRNFQIQISDKTVVSEVDSAGPFVCRLNLTKLKDLRQHSQERVNIAGVISQLKKSEEFGAPLLSVLINDGEADVNVSFWRQAVAAFQVQIGDILHVFGGTVKIYGNFIAVNRPPKNYTLNQKHDDMKYLSNVTSNAEVQVHMSPQKTKPQKIEDSAQLSQSNKKQEFETTPLDCVAQLYNMCPVANCGKSLYKHEHTDHYVCDKCDKTYLVSATGLCLKVTVKNTDTSACVTLFNNLAERFSGKAARDIERDNITNQKLIDNVIGNTYSFVVYGGRKIDEFSCIDFSILEQAREDIGLENNKSMPKKKFSAKLEEISEHIDDTNRRENVSVHSQQNVVLPASSDEPSPTTSSSFSRAMDQPLHLSDSYSYPGSSVPSVTMPVPSTPSCHVLPPVAEKSPVEHLFKRSPKTSRISNAEEAQAPRYLSSSWSTSGESHASVYEQMAYMLERCPPPVDPPRILKRKRSFSMADLLD